MNPTNQARSRGLLAIPFLITLTTNGLSRKMNHYQLHDRSVWASGQTAHKYLKRFKKVPLVTWSKKAAAIVKHRWHAVQHRATCERVIWMTPWYWGKTSQLRDWLDFAIVSVFTNNRTIIEGYGGQYSSWCEQGNWLTCYFEPFHGTQCNGVPRQGPQVKNIRQFGGDRNFIQANSYCGSNTMEIHQAFPNAMWDQLVAKKHIVYHDPDTHVPMDRDAINDFKQKNALLYYSVSLSSLKSIMAKHILIPNKHIQQKADALTQGISNDNPVIAVHMRRTDKHTDGGSVRNLEFSDRFVLKAIGMICEQFFPPSATKTNENCIEQLPSGINVLALSDDTTAIVGLQRHLGHKFNVRTLSNISKLLHSDEERQEYSRIGHKFFGGANARTYEYHASVFVDVVAASRADMLIGVGGSGVSQLIAQRIGGENGADGNALSLWQEDLAHDDVKSSGIKSSIGEG